MAKTTSLMIARQVDTLPAGFHADGGNLYLRVKETGARSWVFRYKKNGKVTELGIGSRKDRTLAQARDLAGKMRTALADGKDPVSVLKQRFELTAKTFRDCALELIQIKRAGWRNAKHAQQWENTLAHYAYPSIGSKLPADITLLDVKAILLPLWATKTETATRLRQRIEAVLDYAAVHDGIDRRNPARWKGNLDKVLPAARKVTKRVHHAAAPYPDVPRIMDVLREKDFLSAYCLRFTVLTATRSGETRGALWREMDLNAGIWTIPGSRMKAECEHRVPLCDEALAILRLMQTWRLDDAERVFPGSRGGLLSDVALNKTLHSVAPDVTVHGFRSAFRDWGAEATSYPSAVLELALAHVNQNYVEAAYQRSDLFERRKQLMVEWGLFLAADRVRC
ncbi:tyrosine-type recombinase/integrase [Nitrosospira sp. Is2]|uniref:tyrosine-type recombinase/integrase n=1 Tax=Nitrosospira sp. Is2 TaxID=3080532 RepID=UPI0029558063|nr:integrase arm-type DNA-binding domain-containing protein [Nitrosospira sp. Is2]WON74772.1 integrase arm-type DNA-binding domain-containing protein [Nitrosospira sp. Is2]